MSSTTAEANLFRQTPAGSAPGTPPVAPKGQSQEGDELERLYGANWRECGRKVASTNRPQVDGKSKLSFDVIWCYYHDKEMFPEQRYMTTAGHNPSAWYEGDPAERMRRYRANHPEYKPLCP
eukprot:6299350-Amphidinium_carterae.1